MSDASAHFGRDPRPVIPRSSETAVSASAAAQDLARQVLHYEAGAGAEDLPDAAALAAAMERASAQLRARLAVRFGPAGFAALLTRALRLARADVPALEAVRFDAEAASGLRGTADFAAAHAAEPAAVAAGLAAILAYLVGLLSTFVGADLAERLVRDTWPALPDGPSFAEGDA